MAGLYLLLLVNVCSLAVEFSSMEMRFSHTHTHYIYIYIYIFVEYNQQDATFHNLFISVRRSTCFSFFVHHQELKTAHTESSICQTNTATCC